MANEQLRERLARYIDQYKDDKESGVNTALWASRTCMPTSWRASTCITRRKQEADNDADSRFDFS